MGARGCSWACLVPAAGARCRGAGGPQLLCRGYPGDRPGVKSSFCSSDITHGCHGNVSHEEGVIGERSGAGMLSSFWSCASLRSGGGGTWPIAPSCVRGGLLLVPPTPGHSVPGAQRGHGTPHPSPCSSQGGLSGNAWARVPRVSARGTEEGPPPTPAPRPGEAGPRWPPRHPAVTGLL